MNYCTEYLKVLVVRRKKQLVLPGQFHQQVLYSLHDDAGHLGIERTTELVKDRFYWPQVTSEVEKYVKSCGRCMARKTLPQKRAPLSNITSSGPMELICIDFLSVEPDSKGIANVLVVTDHFTRYAQAYPAKDQKAVTVAKICGISSLCITDCQPVYIRTKAETLKVS